MKTIHTKNPSRMLKSVAVAAFISAALLLPAASALAETYSKSFTYDLNGNVATRTSPDNATISYSYDGLNKLTDITYPDAKKVSFVYDGNGNRLSMTDPTGTTYYAYDRFNRLYSVQYPGIAPIYYDYDKSGNLTKLTYPDGTDVSYQYDSSNRLWKVTEPNGTTTYEYDNNSNNLTKKTLPNGVSTSYTYDTAKRITDVVNKKSDNNVITSHHYVFDANGNRTQAVDTTPTGSKTTDYTYDKLNRLTNATCSDGAYETYTYDSSGNRLTKTTQNGTITYVYDQDNRLIKIGSATGNTALFYDRSGNLTKKISATKTISYGYDNENRLVSYADGTNTVSFGYDGDGNRISKVANGVTAKYVNDFSSPTSLVLLETNNQSKVMARYTYGDSRLSQLNRGVTSYYLYDNPGRSVVAVVNGSQAVLNSYAYNAFGDTKTINEATPNDFLYTGEQFDDETGLVFLRKRYYDIETGRFLSKDPFPGYVTQPQTVNPYPYTGNNPVNMTDPNGLSPGDIVRAARSHEGDMGWGKPGWKGGLGWLSEYKCNLFVNQAIREAGSTPPLVNGRQATAGELADPKINIPDWPVVEGPARHGDVIAIPEEGNGYSGHTGIVVGQSQTASADSRSRTITISDWGFRKGQSPTVRRCVK